MTTETPTIVSGRLVLDDRVVRGSITVEDGSIAAVDLRRRVVRGPSLHRAGLRRPPRPRLGRPRRDGRPGRARRHGSAAPASRRDLVPADRRDRAARRVGRASPNAFGAGSRTVRPTAPSRWASTWRGRSWPASGGVPTTRPTSWRPRTCRSRTLEPLVDGLRLMTVAPELPGATELIGWFSDRGVAISLGHSAATFEQAHAGFAAGARSTTHLFNAMSGVDHRAPGVAVAALLHDATYVELIADGVHVHPALWPLIARLKPSDRLMVVSDAIALAGMGDGHGRLGGLDVEVVGQRATLAGTDDAGGVGHRPGQRRRATWSRQASRCPPRWRPPAATRWPCWASPTGAGSRSASEPISWSSTTTSTSAA